MPKMTIADISKLAGFVAVRDAYKAYRRDKKKGAHGKNARVPNELRRKAAAFVIRAQEAGMSASKALEATGIGMNALHWPEVSAVFRAKRGPRKAAAMRPVKIGGHRTKAVLGRYTTANGAVTLTTPEGYQIDGSVDTIAALLKSLSGGK